MQTQGGNYVDFFQVILGFQIMQVGGEKLCISFLCICLSKMMQMQGGNYVDFFQVILVVQIMQLRAGSYV